MLIFLKDNVNLHHNPEPGFIIRESDSGNPLSIKIRESDYGRN